jgi:hypothetical protein
MPKLAQDILEFIIFVGLRDELTLYREREPRLVRACCKVPSRWRWGLWYGASELALSTQQADLVTKPELEQNKLW